MIGGFLGAGGLGWTGGSGAPSFRCPEQGCIPSSSCIVSSGRSEAVLGTAVGVGYQAALHFEGLSAAGSCPPLLPSALLIVSLALLCPYLGGGNCRGVRAGGVSGVWPPCSQDRCHSGPGRGTWSWWQLHCRSSLWLTSCPLPKSSPQAGVLGEHFVTPGWWLPPSVCRWGTPGALSDHVN